MKKWIFISTVAVFLFIQTSAAAFCEVLGDAIKNEEGMFFAYIAGFESGEYLLTASLRDDEVMIFAFDEADGAEKTDELGINGDCRVEIVKSQENEYILVAKSREEKFYTLEDDTFKLCEIDEYSTAIKIITVKNGKADTHMNTIGAAYNLLNDMKIRKIKDYNFIDRHNSMTETELMKLRIAIVSAADIMSYDSKNADVDKLMKYVLNTHYNFQGVVPFSPGEYRESDGIKLVNAEYIDYIVKEIFGQEPIHPPINELTSRGYCYNGTNYNYTDAFGVKFSTEVCDIEAVYDVGNDVYYVIFGDIYTEDGVSIPEYSYMILKKHDDGYRILRLEMGGDLLSEHEVMSYAGVEEPKKYTWENAEVNEELQKKSNLWIYVASGAVIAVAAVIAIVWYRRK